MARAGPARLHLRMSASTQQKRWIFQECSARGTHPEHARLRRVTRRELGHLGLDRGANLSSTRIRRRPEVPLNTVKVVQELNCVSVPPWLVRLRKARYHVSIIARSRVTE